MEKLKELTERLCREGALLQAVLSGPRTKGVELPSKVKVKPILVRGEQVYQFERTVGPKVFHENVSVEEAGSRLADWMAGLFKQGLLQTAQADYQILVDKKGRASILQRVATKAATELTHNRKKRYVLEEGVAVPFLVELGVMNAQGKVLAPKYDKFRQINRYLEMIGDVVPYLKKHRRLRIVDFGCGKSYLTFALYHYLVNELKLEADIVGLDLKQDVITHCQGLAERFGYAGLRFEVGDINRFKDEEPADMVVTLHACDTATDAALEKAVRWNADVILSVPCCQHELNGQLASELLSPMLEHGIIKERFASLATDSIRAKLLELVGYRVQLLEFIDMEHTPKNLLIRAVRQPGSSGAAAGAGEGHRAKQRERAQAYLAFKQFLNADPYLERALQDKLAPILSEASSPDAHGLEADL